MVFSNAGVTLTFRSGFLAKNERSDFSAKPMFLPFINKSKDREHRLSCPVRALRWYIDRSRTARGQTQQLVITNTKPYRGAAKTKLAGWLVDVIKRADALVEEPEDPTPGGRRCASSRKETMGTFSKGLFSFMGFCFMDYPRNHEHGVVEIQHHIHKSVP
jgi:hypothetical protein